MSSLVVMAAVHLVGVLVVADSLGSRVPVAALGWARRAARAGVGCAFAGLVAVLVVMVMTLPAQVDSGGGGRVGPPGVDPGTSPGPPGVMVPDGGGPGGPEPPPKERDAGAERAEQLPSVTPAQPPTSNGSADSPYRLADGSEGGDDVGCLPKPPLPGGRMTLGCRMAPAEPADSEEPAEEPQGEDEPGRSHEHSRYDGGYEGDEDGSYEDGPGEEPLRDAWRTPCECRERAQGSCALVGFPEPCPDHGMDAPPQRDDGPQEPPKEPEQEPYVEEQREEQRDDRRSICDCREDRNEEGNRVWCPAIPCLDLDDEGRDPQPGRDDGGHEHGDDEGWQESPKEPESYPEKPSHRQDGGGQEDDGHDGGRYEDGHGDGTGWRPESAAGESPSGNADCSEIAGRADIPVTCEPGDWAVALSEGSDHDGHDEGDHHGDHGHHDEQGEWSPEGPEWSGGDAGETGEADEAGYGPEDDDDSDDQPGDDQPDRGAWQDDVVLR